MAEKKESYLVKGRVKFPSTDYKGEQYNKVFTPHDLKDGDEYRAKFTLVVDPKDKKIAEVLDILDKQQEEIKGRNFNATKPDKQKNDSGELVESGYVGINFTTGFPIQMLDSQLNACNQEIGWGSEVVVKFQTKPVSNKGKVGLGRYVRAIQILDLQKSNVDTSGFEAQDGFTTTVNNTPSAEVVEEWDADL
jgi:hypothetical protein